MREEQLDLTVREWVEAGGSVKTPERVSSDKAYVKMIKSRDDNKKHFTSVSDKECSQVFNTLTLEQAGIMLSMFAYMELGDSGLLIHNGKRLGVKELAKLFKKSESTLKRILSELEAYGYILTQREGRKNIYAVNTMLATRGEQAGEGFFTKVFVARLRDALKVLTVQEAGLLFFMLPYFNSRAYVLSDNPYELDLSKIKLWDREELAEKTGISLRNIKRLVPSMMKKGVLVGIKTCRTAVVLSPELVSRHRKKVTVEDITQIISNELNKTEKMAW
ncbi:helix-turn-helix transcriptional regulator [Metabacillus bambusae]|uniref:Winged helix-turn-helix transcriptional regulator n=1 Tax=Metabacillus bambusae TaxID=2795218 RepID=A0ABS3MZV9_9BACI|nr:winged helix-turn-helix domain-containing protein [Metabacillus bambusae]MBO1511548.1 winged helix-turn-helix transcriptional regulator [Metabacillus bambusae]